MSAYSPSSVPLAGLTEAAAAGVYLSLEEQSLTADGSGLIGPTMGMFPPFPSDGIDG